MTSLEVLARKTFTQQPKAEGGLPGKEYQFVYYKATENNGTKTTLFSIIVQNEKGHYTHYTINEGMPTKDPQKEDKTYLEETLQQILSGELTLALVDDQQYKGQKKSCEFKLQKNIVER